MKKDSAWYGEYRETIKTREKDLQMPAMNTTSVLTMEQKRRNGHEKI